MAHQRLARSPMSRLAGDQDLRTEPTGHEGRPPVSAAMAQGRPGGHPGRRPAGRAAHHVRTGRGRGR